MPGRQEIIDFTKKVIGDMEQFIETEYKCLTKLHSRVIISFSEKRKHSWGGVKKFRPYLNLVFMGMDVEDATYFDYFREYDFIANDPTIGTLINPHWKECVISLCAHEMAHAVDKMYTLNEEVFDFFDDESPLYELSKKANRLGYYGTRNAKIYHTDDLDHGKLWQMIYRELRIFLINNHEIVKYDDIYEEAA
jgi:hypothetical protein